MSRQPIARVNGSGVFHELNISYGKRLIAGQERISRGLTRRRTTEATTLPIHLSALGPWSATEESNGLPAGGSSRRPGGRQQRRLAAHARHLAEPAG
jgi:hypothetical protein